MRIPLLLAASLTAVAVFVASSRPASAEMIEKTGTYGGLKITYKVVLPAGYDATKTYPTVLVFTGGGQSLQAAGNTLEADWRAEGERRGYILVSPAAPDGHLFFEQGDRAFPAFLDAILHDYKVPKGKLHVAGHSNGGLSAFHVAARYPQYFSTLTGYPGLLDGADDLARMPAIKALCISMHVGDLDESWKGAMQKQYEDLKKKGYNIQFAIEKNQQHRLKAAEIDLSRRLYDEIEQCK